MVRPGRGWKPQSSTQGGHSYRKSLRDMDVTDPPMLDRFFLGHKSNKHLMPKSYLVPRVSSAPHRLRTPVCAEVSSGQSAELNKVYLNCSHLACWTLLFPQTVLSSLKMTCLDKERAHGVGCPAKRPRRGRMVDLQVAACCQFILHLQEHPIAPRLPPVTKSPRSHQPRDRCAID